jgi:threonine/homoserine/homoserine lactone efflux protein
MFDPITQGFLLGLAVSMPIGPIGIICIQRSLTHGWLRGMSAGLGATAADLIYACLAAFGISFINDFLVEWAVWFRIPAAALLLLLGYMAFRAQASEGNATATGSSARATFVATFSLMLSNPLTLVFFTAVFAALGGSTRVTGTATALMLIVGVASGCLLWWGLLAGSATLLRNRFRPAALVWVNRVSGIGLAGFGLWLLLK